MNVFDACEQAFKNGEAAGREKARAEAESHIVDSGERVKFDTGAVRDIQKGKGRCDLLPLDIVGKFIGTNPKIGRDTILYEIDEYIKTGDEVRIDYALRFFCEKAFADNPYTMILELSKHYEDGCEKYGERNWEKGIPCHCYVNSAVRHYLKYRRGDADERHDRAFVWNLFCLLWTVKHKPEMNDLPFAKEKTE